MSTEPIPTSAWPAEAPAGACPTCGQPFHGRYCAACGEKRVGHEDLSLKHFLEHSLHEFTHLEHSKVFRTVAALLLRPGWLTMEYLAGRRRPYIAPLRLYLVIFAMNFFLFSFYKPVAIYDSDFLMQADRTGRWARLMDRVALKKQVPRPIITERISQKWHKYMSLFQLVSVVVFALWLKLVYVRSRRYLVEHLIFSLHFHAFVYLFGLLTWPVHWAVGLRSTTGLSPVMALIMLAWAVYLFLALRVVYAQPRSRVLAKTLVLFVGYYVTAVSVMGLTIVLALINVVRG